MIKEEDEKLRELKLIQNKVRKSGSSKRIRFSSKQGIVRLDTLKIKKFLKNIQVFSED